MSHCGLTDAYWADSYEVKGDQYVAIITDTRNDIKLGWAQHIEAGTRVTVPNNKIKWDHSNPTGHGIIFIGIGGDVFCYLPPGVDRFPSLDEWYEEVEGQGRTLLSRTAYALWILAPGWLSANDPKAGMRMFRRSD